MLTEFLRRWKTKSWREEDDRDDFEFWEHQKNKYLKQNPSHGALFDEDEEDEVEDVDVGGEVIAL